MTGELHMGELRRLSELAIPRSSRAMADVSQASG